jgi:hypothetical protein
MPLLRLGKLLQDNVELAERRLEEQEDKPKREQVMTTSSVDDCSENVHADARRKLLCQ